MKSFASILALCLVFSLAYSMVNEPRKPVIKKFTDPIFLNETFYTGLLPIDKRGDLFFWLFESRSEPSTDPLVIWLTGGPGCASEVALFGENGPFKVNSDNKTVRINPYSWNNNANLVFVDQPLGTGFSTTTDPVQNETQLAKDFYTFLQEFVDALPQYKGRDLYITGESYAGHYIPAISANILRAKDFKMNLVGIAIGNGLTSVYYQYPQYADFSLENKLIDQKTYQSLKLGFSVCQSLIKLNQSEAALLECQLNAQRIIGKPPKFNVYDIREPCLYPPLCYDFGYIDDFLTQKKVTDLLNVTGRPWAECNNTVHVYLAFDLIADLTDELSFVTQQGIKVMLYHGDKDFICNWRGGETLSNNLNWSGKGKFNMEKYVKYNTFGEYKHYNNLTFYRVYNAGHMVPMDQPLAALEMLNRFIKGW